MEKINTEFNNELSDRGPYILKDDEIEVDKREY